MRTIFKYKKRESLFDPFFFYKKIKYKNENNIYTIEVEENQVDFREGIYFVYNNGMKLYCYSDGLIIANGPDIRYRITTNDQLLKTYFVDSSTETPTLLFGIEIIQAS